MDEKRQLKRQNLLVINTCNVINDLEEYVKPENGYPICYVNKTPIYDGDKIIRVTIEGLEFIDADNELRNVIISEGLPSNIFIEETLANDYLEVLKGRASYISDIKFGLIALDSRDVTNSKDGNVKILHFCGFNSKPSQEDINNFYLDVVSGIGLEYKDLIDNIVIYEAPENIIEEYKMEILNGELNVISDGEEKEDQ